MQKINFLSCSVVFITCAHCVHSSCFVLYWYTINMRKHHLRDFQKKITLELYKPSQTVKNFDWVHQSHAWRSLFCKKLYYNLHLLLIISLCAIAVYLLSTFFDHKLFRLKHFQVAAFDCCSSLSIISVIFWEKSDALNITLFPMPTKFNKRH